MKQIVYMRPDGLTCVCNPTEGARFARKITLSDGKVLLPEGDIGYASVDYFLRGWPVPGAVADWAETEEEFVQRIAEKDVHEDAIDVLIVEESAISADRTFRNALKIVEGRLQYDMSKCREIQRDRLRQMRAPKFAKLDCKFFKALEQCDVPGQARIATQKQALRDVTADPRLDSAETPEALKAVIPDVLLT